MSGLKPTHKYDDIIHLSRPVSGRRAPMSMIDRGAQFSPFAALTGYEGVIRETARLTDADTVLADGGEAILDAQLRELERRLAEAPAAEFTYFRPDERKAGGSYIKTRGIVKRIDAYSRRILLTDGQAIPLSRLYAIEILE